MNIIFDFDGTIADSLGSVVELLNIEASKRGWEEFTAADIRKKGIGKILVSHKITGWKLYYIVWKMRRELGKKISEIEIFEGLPEAIRVLGKKHKLGIITSNSSKNVREFLAKYDLLGEFDYIDDSMNFYGKDKKLIKTLKKYSLDPTETVYVGDEKRDRDAAVKSGLGFVGVSWGYERPESLRSSGIKKVMTKTEDLVEAF